MTDVLTLDAQRPDPSGIARAAALLRDGRLVAFVHPRSAAGVLLELVQDAG